MNADEVARDALNEAVFGDILKNAPLYWPAARTWMWNYCIYLGPYEHNGKKYDLGVYLDGTNNPSAACVFGNEAGDYNSGDLPAFSKGDNAMYKETYKRAVICGLIKKEEQKNG